MNQLLFFLYSWTDGRPLVLQFTRWIPLRRGCPRKVKTRRCRGTEAERSRVPVWAGERGIWGAGPTAVARPSHETAGSQVGDAHLPSLWIRGVECSCSLVVMKRRVSPGIRAASQMWWKQGRRTRLFSLPIPFAKIRDDLNVVSSEGLDEVAEFRTGQ